MRSVRTALLCLVAAGSCKEDPAVEQTEAAHAVATAYCDQMFSCKCEDSAGFNSGEACAVTIEDQLSDQQAIAVENALVYDPSCVDALIDGFHDLGCARDPDALESCNDCFVYHGLLPEHSPCERYGQFSNCNQGMTCVPRMASDGGQVDVCAPTCLRKGAGDPCALDGAEFQILYTCADGLRCDVEDSGVCIPLPAPGSPCEDGVCGPSAWCDTESDPPICAALKSEGEGCAADTECESTWCRDGARCWQPLSRDEPCLTETDRCAEGLVCPESHPFCSLVDALVCQVPLAGF